MCCSETHNSCAVALIVTIFVGEIEQKQSILGLKSKSLNCNLFFIKILLYKSVSHCNRADFVIRGNIIAVLCCLPKSYFVNICVFFPTAVCIYTFLWVTLCVCAVSLTLGLCKPHLAQHKYIISRSLHWMPFKLELFSRENDVLLVSVCVAVKSLPVPLAIKGSDRKPIPITASLSFLIKINAAKTLKWVLSI